MQNNSKDETNKSQAFLSSIVVDLDPDDAMKPMRWVSKQPPRPQEPDDIFNPDGSVNYALLRAEIPKK